MIRQATIDDLPRLAPGAAEFYASSRVLGGFSIERFTAVWTDLFKLGGVIFIDECAEGVDGAIGGMIHRDIYGEDKIVEEFFWFVRPHARGHSGLRLYKAFERWAYDNGAASIQMVHLLDLNPEKLATFYRRAGYVPVETRYSKQLCASLTT